MFRFGETIISFRLDRVVALNIFTCTTLPFVKGEYREAGRGSISTALSREAFIAISVKLLY